MSVNTKVIVALHVVTLFCTAFSLIVLLGKYYAAR